jgi:hypothetical protein
MSGTALEVFRISGSPCVPRGPLTLDVKGIACTSRSLQACNGEAKAYFSLNPRGKVPSGGRAGRTPGHRPRGCLDLSHVMSNGFITGQVIPVDGGVMLRK